MEPHGLVDYQMGCGGVFVQCLDLLKVLLEGENISSVHDLMYLPIWMDLSRGVFLICSSRSSQPEGHQLSSIG